MWKIFRTPGREDRGAGIVAAQTIMNKSVDAVVSGSTGPNACSALLQAGVRMFVAIPGTVRDNAIAAVEGRLQEVSKPAGRHGHGRGRRR